jgi:hypothetical protein
MQISRNELDANVCVYVRAKEKNPKSTFKFNYLMQQHCEHEKQFEWEKMEKSIL